MTQRKKARKQYLSLIFWGLDSNFRDISGVDLSTQATYYQFSVGPMRHTISVLLQNEAGALSRVAGLFSARGYNIESLSVAPTNDVTVSRLTLVTTGTDAVIGQINKQLSKLVDVVALLDLTAEERFARELLLLKITAEGEQRDAVRDVVTEAHARILEDTDSTYTVQLAGTSDEVDAFIVAIESVAEIAEVVRSGVAAIERGKQCLSIE
jgi:acetolactate synthase-1/3 small subunit